MMALECPVCLDLYNLEDRTPKSLRCSHSLCLKCINKMSIKDVVQCPKCRQLTLLDDVNNNYGLMDVVGEQCEDCLKQKRLRKCHHCDHELCVHCFNGHARSYNAQVNKELYGLRKELRLTLEVSVDRSLLDEERRKEEDALQIVKSEIQHQRELLDEREKSIETRIRATGQSNVKKIVEWTNSLDSEVDQCKDFVFNAEDKLKSQYTAGCTTEEMAEISTKVKNFSTKLKSMRTEKPACDQYKLNEVLCQKQNSHSETNPSVAKQYPMGSYKEIASKLMTVKELSVLESQPGTSTPGNGTDSVPSVAVTTAAPSFNNYCMQYQKQILGERLYPLIQEKFPELAGKITGMLLELDNGELLQLLSNTEVLNAKVLEAVAALNGVQTKQNIQVVLSNTMQPSSVKWRGWPHQK